MSEPIEKLFPSFLAKVRELPAIARVLLVIVILGGPASLTWVYSHGSENIWLRREPRVPLNMLVLAGTAIAFTIAALYLIGHRVVLDLIF